MKTLLPIKLLAIVGLVAVILALKSFVVPEVNTDSGMADIPALLERGERIQLGKEWDAVQNSYGTLLKRLSSNESDSKSYIQLAQLYIKEARVTGEHGHYYPAALEVLDRVIANNKTDDDNRFLALMTKAGVQLSLHDFAEALQTGNAAVVLNPNNAQIHGVLVDAHVELGNYERAVSMADRMIQLRPDIRSYSRVSYLRQIYGDIEGSIKAMQMAVKAGVPGTEETAWAMLTLGEIYQAQGNTKAAKTAYESILEQRPDYPFAVAALGDIALLEGNTALAEAQYEEAISIIPEVGFYISLAKLYDDQGRSSEVDQLIKDILIMLSEDTESGHNMNLEYADLYLDLIGDKSIAHQYATIEYQKRPKNKDVQSIFNLTK